MTIKEKKREISKIIGKNLFDKENEELVKLLFGDNTDNSEEEENKTDDSETAEKADKDETKDEPVAKDNLDSDKKEDGEDKQDEEKVTDAEKAEGAPDEDDKTDKGDVTKAEDTNKSGNDGGDNADGEKADENTDGDINKDAGSNADNSSELFDAKLEAKLLRVGIREDKLEAAKKLFKADHTIEDIEKVDKWVKEYPEWTKQKSQEVKGFGMDVGEHNDAETAEERRLKQLGIT